MKELTGCCGGVTCAPCGVAGANGAAVGGVEAALGGAGGSRRARGGGVVGKGWTWLPAPLAAVVPGGTVTVGATYAGTILEARAYARALATSEVVGQHRGWLL